MSDNPHTLRYAEQGTGHLYEIDLNAGTERQITLTTKAQTTDAVFSPDASTVVLTSYEDGQRAVSLGFIDEQKQELVVTKLPAQAENIAFKDNETLFFSVSDEAGTTGYSRTLDTGVQTQLFSTELSDIQVQWRSKDALIAARPSAAMQGALYAASGSTLTPLSEPQNGLTFVHNKNATVITYLTDDVFFSHALDDDGTLVDQAIAMIPEKCTFDTQTQGKVWCGAPLQLQNNEYLENWYKGTSVSEDYIWSTILSDEQSIVRGDLFKLSGRKVDVTDLHMNTQGDLLLFKNKTDQSLWLYKI
jgi:hypothetical protein